METISYKHTHFLGHAKMFLPAVGVGVGSATSIFLFIYFGLFFFKIICVKHNTLTGEGGGGTGVFYKHSISSSYSQVKTTRDKIVLTAPR